MELLMAKRIPCLTDPEIPFRLTRAGLKQFRTGWVADAIIKGTLNGSISTCWTLGGKCAYIDVENLSSVLIDSWMEMIWQPMDCLSSWCHACMLACRMEYLSSYSIVADLKESLMQPWWRPYRIPDCENDIMPNGLPGGWLVHWQSPVAGMKNLRFSIAFPDCTKASVVSD